MPESHIDKWGTELCNKPLRRMIRRIIPTPDEEQDDDDEGIRHFELSFIEWYPGYRLLLL